MREIRPYGSARGVRRKPYPYRDHPHTRRRRRRAFELPGYSTVTDTLLAGISLLSTYTSASRHRENRHKPCSRFLRGPPSGHNPRHPSRLPASSGEATATWVPASQRKQTSRLGTSTTASECP